MSSSVYPIEIATAIRANWLSQKLPVELLPADAVLASLVDISYQASLLHEEGDSIQCRIAFGTLEEFDHFRFADNNSLNILRFQRRIDLTPFNLRKLAASAGYYRAMLGVDLNESGRLSIWGMILTGTAWVNEVQGGVVSAASLPSNLVIHVVAPGCLTAAAGYQRVLESRGGQLHTEGFDPFKSKWLSERFQPIRDHYLLELDKIRPSEQKSQIGPAFIKEVSQGVVRRMLRLVRTRSRGGMLVYLPNGSHADGIADSWFRFRVRFASDSPSPRYQKLILRLMHRSVVIGESMGLDVVNWDDTRRMLDAELSEIDEALVEYGHVLADMMSVDGSLVIDHSFRLIGFGAEILGDAHVMSIERALDLEGCQTVTEPADTAGTRHRAAYRLVHGLAQAMAIVVSQDGDVRIVANHNNKVTHWPYLP